MQHTDLTLADYRYELDVASVETAENGNTDVLITETSTQNFSQHPEVDTKLYHIMHRFELQETTDGWRIASHIQWDSIYWNLLGEYWGWDSEEQNIPDAETFFSERVTELLTESTQELEMRAEEIQESTRRRPSPMPGFGPTAAIPTITISAASAATARISFRNVFWRAESPWMHRATANGCGMERMTIPPPGLA